MNKDSPNAATRGQRRGFFWQDWYAAWTMLRCWCLPGEGLLAVTPEAPGANHIDDLVVEAASGITFLQLKHTVNEDGNFTGADLFSAQGTELPLIAKLFRGWCRVAPLHERVTVRVVTNARASSRVNNHTIAPAEFERQILRPLAADEHWRPVGPGAAILETIRALSGAPDMETLLRFFRTLEFEFSAPNEDALKDDVVRLLRSRLRPAASAANEASAWLERVYDLSTSRVGAARVSRAEIERELRRIFGSPGRRAEHRLALPPFHLVRPEFGQKVIAKLDEMGSGYLCVFGPPGVGKTTFSTWLAEELGPRVAVRYHLFDPTRSSALERRARISPQQFVETLLDVLSDRFPTLVPPLAPTLETLDDAVTALWGALSDVAKTGSNIVIIDGLDHALRNGGSTLTLLDALRPMAPPGVILLLFGQPDWPYPGWLAGQPALSMGPFSEEQTRCYLAARFGWNPGDPGASAVSAQLQSITRGNPLSLFYNVLALESGGSMPEDVASRLGTTRLFGGYPHETYAQLLEDVLSSFPAPRNSNSLRREIMAYFSTATAAVTIKRLCSAFSEDGLSAREAADALEHLRPVVVDEGGSRFWLFHDDFRRYAEERITEQDRLSAHARHARAIGEDWSGTELKSLAEHLWLAGQYLELSHLSESRGLDDWAALECPEAVVRAHQLAVAGSLMVGQEVRIVRTALATTRAIEVLGETKRFRDDLPENLSLSSWSFVVPPRAVVGDALLKRSAGLDAAARGFSDEPELAREIASRFIIGADSVPSPDDREAVHLRNYVSSLAHWYLRSGSIAELNALILDTERLSSWAVEAVLDVIAEETETTLVGGWATGLVGNRDFLDQGLVRSALRHLAEGRDKCTRAIARALTLTPNCEACARRDSTVLLCLLDGNKLIDDSLQSCGVWWDGARASDGTHWGGFFFHGFVQALVGEGLALEATAFPERFREAMTARHAGDEIALASYIWKLGFACGLATRNPALLTRRTVEGVLTPLAVGRLPGLPPITRWAFTACSGVLLPVVARVLSRDASIRDTTRDIILHEAESSWNSTGERTRGLMEALWLLSPKEWEAAAQRAYTVTTLPGSDGEERVRWFRYWATVGPTRGMKPPESFRRKSLVADLGVARKTDPAWVAVDLLEGLRDPPELKGAIRELVDLLIQLDEEPEGGRASYRNLPDVLFRALLVGPKFFCEEFVRVTGRYSLAEAWGDTPARIALRWLKDDSFEFTRAELWCLWGWIASCAGAFGRDRAGELAGSLIADRVAQRGDPVGAENIRRWLQSLRDPKAEERDAERGSESVRPLPPIEELRPTWFTARSSSEDHQALVQYLEAGGERAWLDVCRRLAVQIVTEGAFAFELQTIGYGIPFVRRAADRNGLFEAALLHLREKTRFQPKPVEREDGGDGDRNLTQVIVWLTARGLEVGDTETVSRTLRSLAALTSIEDAAVAVERELSERLPTADFRTAAYCLSILRMLPTISGASIAAARPLTNHPDAWCRWLACSVTGTRVSWAPMRSLPALPGLRGSDDSPTLREVGASHYAGHTAVSEVYVRKLSAVVEAEEDEIREWLELERRAAPTVHERPLGWHRQEGPRLTDGAVCAAAGRLAARLASHAGPSLHALLSIVARFDPWVALAHPYGVKPDGWVELCRAESSFGDGTARFALFSLGLVARDVAIGGDSTRLGEYGAMLMFPSAPAEFAWVAEEAEVMPAPQHARGPVVPLAFLNRTFTELGRDRFSLVPRWNLPPFSGLRFCSRPSPRWIDSAGNAFLVAVYREWNSGTFAPGHPRVSWETAWYADPSWLVGFLQSQTRLIRFWRTETGKTGKRSRDNDDVTVEYGASSLEL